MFIKVTNDSREGKTVELGQGAGFAQEFSFLTASPRTTNAVMCATAVLEVRMQGR